MTKRKSVRSDRRPYDIRPVSQIRLNKVMSQDALDRLSRYEEVNRQFAEEFPQMAWKFGDRSWIPSFLSPHTERQENVTAASADNTMSLGASTVHVPVHDFEFITSIDYTLSTHSDDADLDVLSTTMSPLTATITTPSDLSDNSDSFASLAADFDPLNSLLPWHDQSQEPCYNHAIQNNSECGMEEQERLDGSGLMVSTSFFEQPAEQSIMPSPEGEPDDFENEALAEESSVDSMNMNQIMLNLNQLGSRLREDARRQLDAITGGCAASPPMCFCEG
ncbi:hypothetical protein ACHAQJ_003924 [Trichoderma viride]